MKIPRPFFKTAFYCFRRGFRRAFALVNLALLGGLRSRAPQSKESD